MNKYQGEYIGKEVKITESKNKTLTGISGRIIDETKNTFEIRVGEKSITVLKHASTFTINGEKIEGDKITKKPEERIKIKEKKNG